MQIDIVAVGRMKAGPEQELFNRYADRFSKSGRALGLRGPRLIELAESRAGDTAIRRNDEADRIVGKMSQDGFLVALAETGDDLPSSRFAALIRKELEHGTPCMAFAIGGPDGHGDAVMKQARLSIRLGSWTWPHQLVRIMLAEQLYRAATILSGHPYHRA